ncbi:MAG: DUF4845 domain-containing protein [Cellvibrionaceae bacterium]
MSSIKQQQGMSALAWLVVITIFGFLLLSISKLGPHYLDNRFVVATLKSLGEDPDFSRKSVSDVREQLSRIFQINNIRGKPTESVKVFKNSNGTIVTIAYEERIEFLYNIDVVLTFNSVLDSSQPDKCCTPPKE